MGDVSEASAIRDQLRALVKKNEKRAKRSYKKSHAEHHHHHHHEVMQCKQCKQIGLKRGCLPHRQKKRRLDAAANELADMTKLFDVEATEDMGELEFLVSQAMNAIETMEEALDELAVAGFTTPVEREEMVQLRHTIDVLVASVQEAVGMIKQDPSDPRVVEILNTSFSHVEHAANVSLGIETDDNYDYTVPWELVQDKAEVSKESVEYSEEDGVDFPVAEGEEGSLEKEGPVAATTPKTGARPPGTPPTGRKARTPRTPKTPKPPRTPKTPLEEKEDATVMQLSLELRKLKSAVEEEKSLRAAYQDRVVELQKTVESFSPASPASVSSTPGIGRRFGQRKRRMSRSWSTEIVDANDIMSEFSLISELHSPRSIQRSLDQMDSSDEFPEEEEDYDATVEKQTEIISKRVEELADLSLPEAHDMMRKAQKQLESEETRCTSLMEKVKRDNDDAASLEAQIEEMKKKIDPDVLAQLSWMKKAEVERSYHHEENTTPAMAALEKAQNSFLRIRDTIDKMAAMVSSDHREKHQLEEQVFVGEVMDILIHKHIPREVYVFEKGEEGHCMYIVAKGAARVELPAGASVFIRQGNIFGEVALFSEAGRRTVPVAAHEHALELYVLEREDLFELLERYPAKKEQFADIARARLEADRDTKQGRSRAATPLPLWVSRLAQAASKRYAAVEKRRRLDNTVENQIKQMEMTESSMYSSDDESRPLEKKQQVSKPSTKASRKSRIPMTPYTLRWSCRKCGSSACPQYISHTQQVETDCSRCGCQAKAHPVTEIELPRNGPPPEHFPPPPPPAATVPPMNLRRNNSARRRTSYFDNFESPIDKYNRREAEEVSDSELEAHIQEMNKHLAAPRPPISRINVEHLGLDDDTDSEGEVDFQIDVSAIMNESTEYSD